MTIALLSNLKKESVFRRTEIDDLNSDLRRKCKPVVVVNKSYAEDYHCQQEHCDIFILFELYRPIHFNMHFLYINTDFA